MMRSRYENRRFICLLAILPLVIVLTSLLPGCVTEKSHTQKIWDENYHAYQKIINSPFIRQVSNGTLDEKIFKDYIIQDYFYLQNFKKVYEILLSKAPDERSKEFIANEIKGIDEEIESVHKVYFRKYNVTDQELLDSTPNPTTQSYNSYLIETATRLPFEVGLIATLPCNWIYYQVGADLEKAKKVAGNPYQEWIDAYGTTSWEKSDTKDFVDLVEHYMKNANEKVRKKMEQAYKTAAGFEYMFWDTVYKESNKKGASLQRRLASLQSNLIREEIKGSLVHLSSQRNRFIRFRNLRFLYIAGVAEFPGILS